MKILVTGAAGFIGMHVAKRLLAEGVEVVGIDNFNDYYDIRLKEDRLKQLLSLPGFRFVELDVTEHVVMKIFLLWKIFGRTRNVDHS